MTAAEVGVLDADLGGQPSRFVSPATEVLNIYAKGFEDLQQVRMASSLRGDTWLADRLKKEEDAASRRLGKALRDHELWPFLAPLKGLAGPRTGRVIAEIGDPRRFPGQPCTAGHYLPAGYPVGAPCPISADADMGSEVEKTRGVSGEFASADGCREVDTTIGGGEVSTEADSRRAPGDRDGLGGPSSRTADDGAETESRHGCPGILLAPRLGTGVRSLWHYAGLHAIDGRMPQRRKGVQADWKPTLRTLALGPDGLADQIIKHRTPKYRDIYDATKERKAVEELPPWKVHKIARTVAAKAFLGDLLVTWKETTA